MKFKLSLLLFVVTSMAISSQEKQVLEFNNKPVVDVLMVLADLSDKNIIPDDSVSGICSYYFTTDDMDEALDLFLKSQNLFITKMDTAYKVSKIFTEMDKDKQISLITTDTDIKMVLDRLTAFTGITILYDSLPRSKITLNIKRLSLNVILEIIMKKFSGYEVEPNDGYFYIKKLSVQNASGASSRDVNKTNGIKLDDAGNYSISLNKVRFTQVIAELFEKEDKEYSIQGRNDNIIDRLEHSDKTFEEMLTLILEGGSCDYVLSNGIYYIFDINKTEVANKHIETKVIQLENISAKDLLKLMPGSFMSNNALKIDEATNSVIVYGTKIKTSPIIDFITLVDKDQQRKPYKIEMNFASSDTLKNILLKTYSNNNFINIDKNSFLILLTEIEYEKVQETKRLVDTPPNSHKITLKYIKSEQLLENLPKTVEQEQIVVTPNPSVIFYYGEDDGYRAFMKELDGIDRPVPQIKYKVLVLEKNENDNFDFGIKSSMNSAGKEGLSTDQWASYSGELGNLLKLNFNALAAFGPAFSFELEANLSNNDSKILVDTTLKGLSGKKVSFRNTKTSRYVPPITTSDGKEAVGATQETSWGIIIDIEGWTSGDGIVTVNVQSTISDETKLSSDQEGGIPSTSEKVVNTEVRTPEGVPVVIGGLLDTKTEQTLTKTPFLGDIPLLGFFFRKTKEVERQSEFVIYLIPYIENMVEENIDEKLKRAYREYVN